MLVLTNDHRYTPVVVLARDWATPVRHGGSFLTSQPNGVGNMLLLTRKLRETVVIRDEKGILICTVTIDKLDRGKVVLGFDARSAIKINREEVDERKFQESH
jgi:carbon storage regulator CsrA